MFLLNLLKQRVLNDMLRMIRLLLRIRIRPVILMIRRRFRIRRMILRRLRIRSMIPRRLRIRRLRIRISVTRITPQILKVSMTVLMMIVILFILMRGAGVIVKAFLLLQESGVIS